MRLKANRHLEFVLAECVNCKEMMPFKWKGEHREEYETLNKEFKTKERAPDELYKEMRESGMLGKNDVFTFVEDIEEDG